MWDNGPAVSAMVGPLHSGARVELPQLPQITISQRDTWFTMCDTEISCDTEILVKTHGRIERLWGRDRRGQ